MVAKASRGVAGAARAGPRLVGRRKTTSRELETVRFAPRVVGAGAGAAYLAPRTVATSACEGHLPEGVAQGRAALRWPA